MDKALRTFFQLMADSLGKQACIEHVSNQENWQRIFAISQEQGLSAVLYDVVKLLPDEYRPEAGLMQAWKKKVMISMVAQMNINDDYMRMLGRLIKEGVIFILIKGAAIYRFYGRPEQRPMGDLDILVAPQYMEHAKKVVEDMGYSIYERSKGHVYHYVYMKKGSITIEIHRALYNPGFLGDRKMDFWYEHIWKNSIDINVRDLMLKCMSVEDEFINQVVHFWEHFVYHGAKLKNIYDMALIIKKNKDNLNWAYIADALDKMGFTRVTKTIYAICSEYLNIDIPVDISGIDLNFTDEFLYKFVTQYTVEVTPNDKRGWKNMSWKTPALCKNKWLIAIPYCIEFLIQMLLNKGNVLVSLKYTGKNMSVFKSKISELKMLELI